MIYLYYVLILLILIFTVFRLHSKTKILIYLLLSILISVLLIVLFYKFYSLTKGLVIVLYYVLFLSLLFLNIGNRPSILYSTILFLTFIITLIGSVLFSNCSYYFCIIALLVYFLSELKQDYLRKSYEDSCNEYQKKILNQQIEEVQSIYLKMRGWRHDYHNHLQSIKAYLSLSEYANAIKYLNDLEVDLKDVNTLVETGNIDVDAILNAKLSVAINQGIKINYKITVPSKLTISNIDLCVLLGNLIDNAIEASIKTNDKFIRLYIGIFKQQLYISITNSTNEFVRKIDTQYITTKRGNHGHGLKRINNIVNKYAGFINRKNEPGVFVTEIMLPL